MTKCLLFWRKVAEFKAKDDFEGFREWCDYKSYEQARMDWNAIDTFSILANKLGQDLCSVLQLQNCPSEGALRPIILQREYVSEHETVPAPIQEKAIEVLLPKIKAGAEITDRDSIKALAEAKGEPIKEEKLEEKKLCDLEQTLNDLYKIVNVHKSEMLICSPDECKIYVPCQEVTERIKKLGNIILTGTLGIEEYA